MEHPKNNIFFSDELREFIQNLYKEIYKSTYQEIYNSMINIKNSEKIQMFLQIINACKN